MQRLEQQENSEGQARRRTISSLRRVTQTESETGMSGTNRRTARIYATGQQEQELLYTVRPWGTARWAALMVPVLCGLLYFSLVRDLTAADTLDSAGWLGRLFLLMLDERVLWGVLPALCAMLGWVAGRKRLGFASGLLLATAVLVGALSGFGLSPFAISDLLAGQEAEIAGFAAACAGAGVVGAVARKRLRRRRVIRQA